MNHLQIKVVSVVSIIIILLVVISIVLDYLVGIVLFVIFIIVAAILIIRNPNIKTILFNRHQQSSTEQNGVESQDGTQSAPKPKSEYRQTSLIIENYNEPIKELKGKIQALEDNISALSNKDLKEPDSELDRRLNDLESKIKRLESKIAKLQEGLSKILSSQPSAASVNLQEDNVNQKLVQPEIFPKTYYAQAVDSVNPLGFTLNGLTDQSDRSFFVITILNEHMGEYKLVDSPNILNGIISFFNPLITNSSEYDSIPQTISRVCTSQPGTLVFSNGIWQITKKQKIIID